MPARLHNHRRDETGQALVLVLVVSMLLIGLLAVAFSKATANLGLSSQYASSSQSSLASLAGLNAAQASIKTATLTGSDGYGYLPCSIPPGSLSVPGAVSTYTVTVVYSTNGAIDSCTGTSPNVSFTDGAQSLSTVPTAAMLQSTGKAPHGSETVMQEEVSMLPQALGYGFVVGEMTGSSSMGINQYPSVGVGPEPIIYIIGNGSAVTLPCTSSAVIQGGIVSYVPINIASSCTIDGSIVVNGSITSSSSDTIEGNVTAYGGAITLISSSTIDGNATAAGAGGTISLSSNAHVDGTAAATGAISIDASSSVGSDDQYDTALSSETAPAPISFPFTDPTGADWTAAGWTNVVSVGPSTQLPPPSYTCAGYFQNTAGDPFLTEISKVTSPTVIYAPTCNVSYSSSKTLALNANVALQVNSLTLFSSVTLESTSVNGCPSDVCNLSILAEGATPSTCSTALPTSNPPGGVSIYSSVTTGTPSVTVFIYTPDEINTSSTVVMYGQILACGGFNTGSSATFYFVPSASAADLPWWTSTLSVTVEQKIVLQG